MNRENAKSLLENIHLLKAFAEGKEIEYRPKGCTEEPEWMRTQNPVWSFDCVDYRVKKEPRYLWAVYEGGEKMVGSFGEKCNAVTYAKSRERYGQAVEVVKLVEPTNV